MYYFDTTVFVGTRLWKDSVSLACYWQIGSKFTNHRPIAWREEGGSNWWISIRSVNNTQDWRKFWKCFRGCFVFQSRVSTKTMVRELLSHTPWLSLWGTLNDVPAFPTSRWKTFSLHFTDNLNSFSLRHSKTCKRENFRKFQSISQSDNQSVYQSVCLFVFLFLTHIYFGCSLFLQNTKKIIDWRNEVRSNSDIQTCTKLTLAWPVVTLLQ